jgi:death-on-curing family protein
LNLTKNQLIKIHEYVQKRFKTSAGLTDEGLIDGIVSRPDLVLNGNVIFQDIYSKAASLMETMRWHAFVDGNKRTMLLATQYYLENNGYYFMVPYHSVRFCVDIANTQGVEPEITNELILKISDWLKDYVARSDDIEGIRNIQEAFDAQLKEVSDLIKTDKQKAIEKINHWLAVDVYPEYSEEVYDVLDFIGKINFTRLEF